MASSVEANQAKRKLIAMHGHKPWFGSAGISSSRGGEINGWRIHLILKHQTDEVSSLLTDGFEGVPVEVVVAGEVKAR